MVAHGMALHQPQSEPVLPVVQLVTSRPTIPAQAAPATGTKEVEYYWAYRDAPAPPNGGVSGTTGTTPAGGTGIPSNMQTHPSSPYSYEIEHVDNAADGDNKWQLKSQWMELLLVLQCTALLRLADDLLRAKS